jgi:hypothetical protein
MSADKLILTKSITLDQVTNYFKNLDPDKRVRARKNDDGLTELYVRNNSFKQFFTDKLKLGFLVKRDYLEAKQHIVNVLNNSGVNVIKSPSLVNLKKGLDAHSHDFVAKKFNSQTENFLYNEKEIRDAKKLLDDNWKAMKLNDLPIQLISGPEGQKEISRIIGFLENPEDQKILQRNFDALNNIMFSDDSSKPTPTVIDCHHAIDFSRAWQNAMSELIGKTSSDNTGQTEGISFKKDSSLINVLTNFSKRITAWSKLETIDYKAGKVGESNADLIIIDPALSPSYYGSLENNTNGKSSGEAMLDQAGNFTLKNYTDFRISESEEKATAVKITYQTDSQLDRAEIDSLYENIGKIIDEKMDEKSKLAPNELYIIHLPILKLDESQGISADNKMAYKAFSYAEEKWTKAHPKLRIKVQWPVTIDKSKIDQKIAGEAGAAAYRKLEEKKKEKEKNMTNYT